MLKKILLLLAGLQLAVVAAHSQPYYLKRYQVENGLSHNTIFSTAQDKNGFMWIGTKDGLNRFDGYHFKTFPVHDEKRGMVKDLILSLATGPDGKLWVGTQKGLFYFDAERERFIPMLDTLHGINDIFFDRTGQLWFTANVTLNRYNFHTGRLSVFPPDLYFGATSLCEDADGNMWFSSANGYLFAFDTSTQAFKRYDVFDHSPSVESKVIQKIVYNEAGSIIIGTRNQGIKEFTIANLDYKDILTSNADKTTIYVHDILQVSSHEIWFATESGIFIWDKTTGKFTNLKKKFLDPYSLSDNAIYTLYKDAEGGIWAGTFFGGENYFPYQYTSFQKFFPDYSANSISGNAVREICEDAKGNIWIGTEDAGLNKLNGSTRSITRYQPDGTPETIAYSNIHGLLVVKDELWIGTFEHGLDIMDIHTGKVKKHYKAGAGKNQLKSNFIVSLLQTRNGDIYLGTANGLCKYNPEEDNFQYPDWVTAGTFVPCIIEDREGAIWAASHNRGLFYFNPSTGKKGCFLNEPGSEHSLPINSINSIYEDSKGALWLSTEGGGLCSLDTTKKKFIRYSTKNGLPSNLVFKVLEDNKHTLWITTSKGLVNLAPATGKLTVYLKANGLLNDQFNYNSGYKDKQGNLYFGSVQGMIKFNPDAFNRNRFIPPICITGLQVQNKEIDITKDTGILKRSIVYTNEITLPYDQSSFSIDFAALTFTSPATTAYSYIMSGLDKAWTDLASNRKVYFTNLKPGKYTFKVKAINNHISRPQVREIRIIIAPPYWATPWAYILYTLVLVSLIYYGIRTYHQFHENKKEKEIYHAKMEFFTNIAHEIKTPLTLIKGPIENLSEMVNLNPDIKEDVGTMERNADRLLTLSNQILDFRQTEIKGFSLNFSDANIKEIFEEAYITFKPLADKKDLTYILEMPVADVRIMADAEALTKVFNNLFSNAVKYAHHEIKAVLLLAGKNENVVIIEISNDGYLIPPEMREKIFEPFFRIKETIKQKGTGLGLALARSLVELHGGKIYVKEGCQNQNVFVVELPFAPMAARSKNKTAQNNQTI